MTTTTQPPLATDDPELMQLGAELAAAEVSPWQPRCVAAAFRTKKADDIVFTMQRWLDLDWVRSPLLIGELPPAEEIAESLAVFGIRLEPLPSPEEALEIGQALVRVIDDAFAMAVPMRVDGEETANVADNGLGDWLKVYSCLVGQFHISPAAAKAMEVGEALALIAGDRGNRGWTVTGTSYRMRDVLKEEEKPEASGQMEEVDRA